MYFNSVTNVLRESDDTEATDALLPKDVESQSGMEAVADEVEEKLQREAFEHMSYFDGGQEAGRAFFESAEVQSVMESMPQTVAGLSKKKTLVLLSKNDDLERRKKLACLIIAREKKDPRFDLWIKHRRQEREDREYMYQKYDQYGAKVARISQKKHIAERRKFPLPIVKKPEGHLGRKEIAGGAGTLGYGNK